VQLRLVCNLLDGMAIEGGKSTATGALFNEIPDRLADALFLVPLGYASGYPARLAGGAARCIHRLSPAVRWASRRIFDGTLPKQRRMAVLTVARLVQAVEDALWGSRVSLLAAAIIITIGSFATSVSRTIAIARRLEEASLSRFCALVCSVLSGYWSELMPTGKAAHPSRGNGSTMPITPAISIPW
jgi:phosphatidylglycerophosphate synthase